MKKEKISQALVIMVGVFFIFIGLSGCTSTSNQNTNSSGNTDKFLGTWTGSVQMSAFGGRSNTSLTKTTFTDTIAQVSLSSGQGSFTMNYTYTVDANTLVLTPSFSGRGGFPGRQPYNGSYGRNGTRPWNGTRPPMNGTSPRNWTRPENGTGFPPGGQQPSMSLSFTYRFNTEYTFLYLNDSQFTKK